ncbi:arylacetamide deacetylase-like 2 [Sorex fumeus]|uniref:arylacetamide deacetylase-like 2 n=1 Tax=Sorex fumeus TaxID=62283 RepID=UPI0024AE105A|nr:arylacetamide deacetylase-like 2 [Sorex fumeus]
MGPKALYLGLLCLLFAYYFYTPIPSNIEERWKVRILDAMIKTCTFTATCLENIGIMRSEDFLSILLRLDYTQPFSDENVTVSDLTFVGIPVRLYLPKRKPEIPRRAVIYFHGGSYCLGSFKQTGFDLLNRWTSSTLEAVVLAVDYRLAPQHVFPAQFEDSFAAVKYFLQDEVLMKYEVDPTRICISGDSAGGALAAAVTQQVQNDLQIKHKIKAQALLYPHLQIIDSFFPSHQENEHGIFLTKDLVIKFLTLYLGKDEALFWAIKKNHHMPLESRYLFQFANWSILLPEKYRKGFVYTEPILGKSRISLPALTDIRTSPLLANDTQLKNLPATYILTCQYDIIRDDGLMYVSRLQKVGVHVTNDHIEDGLHGALSFMAFPISLKLGLRIRDLYISWLDKNL